ALATMPRDPQRAAVNASKARRGGGRGTGDRSALADRLTSFKEREEIVRTRRYLELDTQ
ncbi:isocitrate lyase, partial [Achromobacter ruhlandii]|nr:isocitrate lyase [Achromobacter ruhlandii]